MVRVLLVEKVRLVREVSGAVLEGEPDIHVFDMAINEEDALRAMRQSACDIVLVSTSLPENGVLSLVNAAREEELGVPELSGYPSDQSTLSSLSPRHA